MVPPPFNRKAGASDEAGEPKILAGDFGRSRKHSASLPYTLFCSTNTRPTRFGTLGRI